MDSLRSAPDYTSIPDPYRSVPAQQIDIATTYKANAFYITRMPQQLQDTNADNPALNQANYQLRTSETSRLSHRVRETQG
ncbi:hypothetical protein, partial [Bordetella holmesii]|uniref:hypothetical protein n=1 Tax=Bordetella holmesii TaxID=35814 RepID=UPI001F6222F6